MPHPWGVCHAGVVCDKGLTLGDLIGILHLFFSRLGLKKLRFKPAFNPYTEPSMEIFSYSEQLQKWVEVSAAAETAQCLLLHLCLLSPASQADFHRP